MSDTQKKTTSTRKTNATKAKEANAQEKVTKDETEVSTSPGQEGVANASPEDKVAAQVSDESREDRIEAEDNRAALTGDEDSDAYADQDPFLNADFLRPRGVIRTDGTPQETYESLRKNIGLFDRKGVDPRAEGPAVPSRVYRTGK